MDNKIYRLLTWNVNGLRTRHTDLHSYVLLHKPDIISLQETGPVVPGLRGYDSHVLGCNDGSSRGLVTYVKLGLPVTLVEMGVNGGTEFIAVCLHLVEGDIYFINMYVQYILGLYTY